MGSVTVFEDSNTALVSYSWSKRGEQPEHVSLSARRNGVSSLDVCLETRNLITNVAENGNTGTFSSDLNPVERVWWLMRNEITHNQWIKSM